MFERAFMEEDLDPFEFVLAENLHMTVAQLREQISTHEYVQWQAFYVYRKAMTDLESKERR